MSGSLKVNGLGELNTTPNVSAIANVHPDKVKLNRLFYILASNELVLRFKLRKLEKVEGALCRRSSPWKRSYKSLGRSLPSP